MSNIAANPDGSTFNIHPEPTTSHALHHYPPGPAPMVSHFDYCNSSLTGLLISALAPLESIFKKEFQLILKKPGTDQVSPQWPPSHED